MPKYRKRVLEGVVAQRLEGLFREAAEERGWVVHEMSVQPDHVHLLVQLGPDVSVAYVVQILKGVTSFKLRREFRELGWALWGKSLWADGYFAESVGVTQEETIRRYIKDQDEGRNV